MTWRNSIDLERDLLGDYFFPSLRSFAPKVGPTDKVTIVDLATPSVSYSGSPLKGKNVVAYFNKMHQIKPNLKQDEPYDIIINAKPKQNYCEVILSSILSEFDITKKQEINEYDRFVPSLTLASLMISHLDRPVEEERAYFDKIKRFHGVRDVDFSVEDIVALVSDEIEGFFSNIAKRAENEVEAIFLTKDNRFRSDICKEIIDRLQLDAYNPRPVLDLLHSELYNFLSISKRKRYWGQLALQDFDIKLELSEESASFIDFNALNDRDWINLR